MAAPECLYLRQLLLAHRGTAFGDNLRAKFQHPALATQMNADLRNPDELSAALTLVRALGGGMSAEEEAELNNKIAEGLPFFIKWELVQGVPNLYAWQRRFVAEAKRQWQEEGRKRLLGVYATGTGKSAIVACASYCGSRERSLVVVPNKLLLKSMAETLGAPYPPGEEAPDNPAPPALRKYGLIAADAPMPKVLVLSHLGTPTRDHMYDYTAGGYNPQPGKRSIIDIIRDHDIVLATAQLLSREKKAAELDANGDPVDIVDGRVIRMHDWIVAQRKPLFNLLIFDEAHHIKCCTWTAVRNQLGGGIGHERLVDAHGQIISPINVLLVTATPYHDAGDLDVFAVRDAGPSTAPPMTPYTLIDAHEDNVVKGVVFLNINTHPEGQPSNNQVSWKLDVLKLTGYILRSKMDAQPHIQHRALILVKDTAAATALVDAYNGLDDKPLARPGEPVVVESYFNPTSPTHPTQDEMDQRLDRFKITSDPNPIHVLVQCAKLGEGYDQPNISVVGICSREGFGGFNPAGEDDDNEADVDDNATTASEHIPLNQLYNYPETQSSTSAGPSVAEPPAKKLKPSNGPRKVDRYVLARTVERQAVVLGEESGQHDSKPYMATAWEFVNRTTVVAPSS